MVAVNSRDRDVRKIQSDQSFERDFVGDLTGEKSVFAGTAKNELVDSVRPCW
jgi:hypothetical protein